MDELLNSNGNSPVEVGLDSGFSMYISANRFTVSPGENKPGPRDVVVITGGARGVTASAACALAKHAKLTLVLMGRSSDPTPEPEWLAPLHDEAVVKKAILENEFGNTNITPVELEKAYKKHMANREIITTLDTIKSSAPGALFFGRCS